MSDVHCPACGSRDLAPQPGSSWRCRQCDTVFVATGGATPAPARAAGGDQRRAWIVVAGASAVALGGLLWWIAPVPDRAVRGVDAPPVPADRPINPPRPVDNTPDFQLVHQQLGTTADGRRFALQSFRNLERYPISQPVLRATFFKDGVPKGDLTYPGMLDPLLPGTEIPILVDMGHEDFDNVEILAETPRPATGTDRLVALGTHHIRQVERGGKTVLTGVLRNIADHPLVVEQAVFVGWTTDGEPVAWAPATLDEKRLKPGDEAEIDAEEIPYVLGDVDLWTAYGAGSAPVRNAR
ncbi:MAG: hypothetical protein H6733_04425 [Alphaproteobacteria bacterium]|nr:hypothetical protein [Alphaproteobacteria bacterium]